MISLLAPAVIVATLLQAQPAPRQPAPEPVPKALAMLAAMAANEFAKVEAQFTDNMKAAWPAGRLAATWAKLVFQAGPFKSCGTDPRVVGIDSKTMVITPCQFERGTLNIQLAFDDAGRISGMVFRPAASTAGAYPPPPYARPASYTETEVTVGAGDWALPATLSVPVGSGRWPAVILVHGSGPNDRDETIGASKPFRDLATGLASRGVAVLRYDKRNTVHAARLAAQKDRTVKQEVIDDALAAVKTLRAQSNIDGARIFVLGHSLGGMLIPRIATADPTIAGVIVLGGAARPLEEAIAAQAQYLANADGTITPEEQQTLAQTAALVNTVRALTSEDAKSGRVVANIPASYWLDLSGYDPPSAAKEVKQPMLILQGERDYQVTMEEFGRWKAALGARADVTFRSYPALNHLFIAGSGPSLPAEYQTPGHVAEDVIRDIAAWILARRR